MPPASRPGIQVVPYVGQVRPGGAATSPEVDGIALAGRGAAGLRWVALLAVATLLVDVVGASQAHSMALAISAIQSVSQSLTLGAAMLVGRHRPSPAVDLPFDPPRADALARFVSGLVLLVLSVPIAYRALGSLCLTGDCDAAESACILALGLCSSGLSAWLLLRAEPETGPARRTASPARALPPTLAPPRGEGGGLFAAAAAGHLVDVQTSVALLLAMLVSGLFGWSWVDAAAGLLGAFLVSFAAARLVVASGAALIDARPAGWTPEKPAGRSRERAGRAG